MQRRRFGSTDLMLSEVGFGAWAIGGQSFGPVSRVEALDALSQAEELGCNFIDTASVYGNAESIIGDFLSTRRDRWIVASKYSGQKPGLKATLEAQLQTLRIEAIDLYQLHWMPGPSEQHLIEELQTAKRDGKIRYLGVSLYTANDLERAITMPELDGIQVKISLLSPNPFHEYRHHIQQAGKGVLARSALEDGFLTGKYDANTRFSTPGDRRATFRREEIGRLADQAQAFQALCNEELPLHLLATRYALAFPQVSSLLLSSKSPDQAQSNFGTMPQAALDADTLAAIETLQTRLRLFDRPGLVRRTVRRLRRLIRR